MNSEREPTRRSVIPRQWKFYENKYPDLKVLQIDQNNRHLKLMHGPTDIDYLFNLYGLPIYSKHDTLFGIYGVDGRRVGNRQEVTLLRAREFITEYTLSGKYIYNHDKEEKFTIGFVRPEDITKKVWLGFFSFAAMTGNQQASFDKNGNLETVFIYDWSNKALRRSPSVLVTLKSEDNESGWYVDKGDYFYLDKNTEDKAILANEKGRKIFTFEKKMVEKEDSLGNKRPFMVVTETHNGFVTIFEVPLRVDFTKVKEALLAPYPNDSRGGLDVPWRNIDDFIGARVIYPEPKKRRNKK